MSSSLSSADHLYQLRHSAAHMLAAAALNLYPGTKLGTGPVTETGFYYDLLLPQPISDTDLQSLETEMREIINGSHDFVRKDTSRETALEFFKDQPFKQELIEKFSQAGKDLTLYESGPFTDLCEGGHVKNTQEINPQSFKLTKIAGAYWQASEANPQMTRVYGVLFETEVELNDYFAKLAEAEARDHRKLGKELELFTVIDDIGPGLPLFYPKGATLRKTVEDFIATEQEKRGFVGIWVPHIAKGKLYEISGHLGKYDAMFAPMHIDDVDYYLKPMNCPHFMMLYKSQPHSYKDLPLRYTCTTTVYRNEKSGELSGLTRVRGLTQDDCHVFMRADQIEAELDNMIDLIKVVYQAFGLTDFWVSISTSDAAHPENYLGDQQVWKNAEATLEKVIAQRNWQYKIVPGEAAFYGPKLDFIAKDAIGREWQLSTLQLDFNLPERFDLEYIDGDNQKQRPVVVHRAVLGSIERWLGVMIEHFAGNFPTWLAPVQVQLIAVSEKHVEHCQQLAQEFKQAGMRVEVNSDNETVGNKIRKATKMKIPYLLVIGDKEIAAENLAIRKRGEKETVAMSKMQFVEYVREKNLNKSLEL